MTDDSEPPTAAEPPSDHSRAPDSTHAPDAPDARDGIDTPDGIDTGAGTVLAFRSRQRRDAAGRSASDRAGREPANRSGYDVDNEPVLADETLVDATLADETRTGGTGLPVGTGLAGAADLTGPAVLTAEIQNADRDDQADDARPVDWAWVEEWRAGREPVPWASGLGLAAFSALVVGVAVWVLSAGLAGSPVLAIGVNLLVAGGLTPAMWLSRGLPVLRWIALGSAVGVLAGWVCALTMLPLPTP